MTDFRHPDPSVEKTWALSGVEAEGKGSWEPETTPWVLLFQETRERTPKSLWTPSGRLTSPTSEVFPWLLRNRTLLFPPALLTAHSLSLCRLILFLLAFKCPRC